MKSKMQLDHVVIAVRDLDDASRTYRKLGFNVVAGGVHGHAPTRNALIVFSDGSFMELIEWTARSPGDAWQRTLEAHGEGLVDFALTTQDLNDVFARARSNGIEMGGPIAGSRTTPEGVVLQWQTGRPASRELPFVCLDITARAERVPTGDVRIHPNGVTGVIAVVVAVVDAYTSLDRYLGAFDIHEGSRFDLTEMGVRVGIADLASWQLVLISNTASAPTGLAASVHRRAARRGVGPCALVLRSPGTQEARTIKPADACGVPLRLCAGREPPNSYLDSLLQA
ncbi:VOC family protein [Paraburkholderia azotifigens]|uniref:VOC family protein n=1 Tax=Paraburkholderia azotifigens TaxID=2057004 RepID=A0A5C6VFK0_9BURK|nr:VOC family protein [Paraburkholderia azotifigens]TXC83669.1 VOC family protein [Paraburkholderia azotifigens]